MKKLVTYTLLSSMMAMGLAHAQQEIRIATDPTYPPYESYNPEGKLVGIDVEIGNYVCAHLKLKCKWVSMGFDAMIPALRAHKIDMILSSMSITPARKKVVAFSDPIYLNTTRLMVRKDSPELGNSVDELKGKTIGVGAGTIQAAYANKYWAPKGVKIVAFDNDQLSRQDLVLGRIDGVLEDVPAAESFFQTPAGKNFKLTGQVIYDAKIFGDGGAMAFRKSDQKLVQDVNKALAEMRRDGTYAKVLQKYHEYGLLDPVTKK